MLIIITLLIVLNYRKSKTNVKDLGELNRQVSQQKNNLQSALNNLENSVKDKDRILRTVAHDLRNPIGGIASLTAIMADDPCTDDQRQMIGLIRETSLNSLVLINELMEVTSSNADNLTKEHVDINALVSNCVELLRFRAAEKNQDITMKLLPFSVKLNINREKIWRVVSNLISNAIKFSQDGQKIEVGVVETDAVIEITVKDSGIGIPDNFKNSIFNTFTDAKRSGTAGEKSFGLGLSISKQIIESHHGNIWFESMPEHGTTFFMALPKEVMA